MTTGDVVLLFCRYKAELKRQQCRADERPSVVPALTSSSSSSSHVGQTESLRVPDVIVDPDIVFLCRYVYDVKLHRILKNPPAHSVPM